ncbi:MAG: hypothetical protein CM1200mP27_11430 [Chloroflexota bacterium]|nr:MAG: hypothetical protein CM1200mP27_11430 [Chloroflexota bacterium]
MRADLEIAERLREKAPRRPVTTGDNDLRGKGQMAALGAQVLRYGFYQWGPYMDGGMRGWKSAGPPTSE